MALLTSSLANCRRRSLLRALAAAWLGCVVAAALPGRAAPAPSATESEVKADYLFLFTKYVEWPQAALAATNQPIMVGVIGDDALADALERRVKGRLTQGGRPVAVRRARLPADLAECHVIFVGQGERRNVREITEAVRGKPILTVCDADGLFTQGFMIKFGLVEGSVRFEVRLEPVERAGLSIHSGMLGSAKKVWPKASSSSAPP